MKVTTNEIFRSCYRYFSCSCGKVKPNYDVNVNNYYLNFHKENAVRTTTGEMKKILFETPEFDEKFVPSRMGNEGSFAEKFINQVVAITLNTKLMDSPHVMKEAKEKAKQYLKLKNFSVGAYSEGKGSLLSRKNLTHWYQKRDGFPISEEDIYLTYGSANAYETVINLIATTGESMLVPNPCYPVYLNYNRSLFLENVFYDVRDLLDLGKLSDLVKNQRDKGKNLKSILVLNPHYPLGSIMSTRQMEEVIKFCQKNNLLIIASESLQNSVYPDAFSKFVSFRKLMQDMKSKLELLSINTLSYAPFFNSGLRCGILDTLNLDIDMVKQLYKIISIDICSCFVAQIMTDFCLNPPHDLGNEFMKKYNQSISDIQTDIYMTKNKVFRVLQKDGDLVALKDIQAGFSFFVQTKNRDKDYIVDKTVLRTTPGHVFGTNFEKFINIDFESLL